MFGPSTAAAFLTHRGTLAEVSTTASHLRPSRALRSSFSRSPCSFSRSGNRPGRVLPRLNSVTLCPRRQRRLDGLRPEEAGAAQHQDGLRFGCFCENTSLDRAQLEQGAAPRPTNSRRVIINNASS